MWSLNLVTLGNHVLTETEAKRSQCWGLHRRQGAVLTPGTWVAPSERFYLFRSPGWWVVIGASQEEGKGNMEASSAQTLKKHKGYRARQGCLRMFQNTFALLRLGGVEKTIAGSTRWLPGVSNTEPEPENLWKGCCQGRGTKLLGSRESGDTVAVGTTGLWLTTGRLGYISEFPRACSPCHLTSGKERSIGTGKNSFPWWLGVKYGSSLPRPESSALPSALFFYGRVRAVYPREGWAFRCFCSYSEISPLAMWCYICGGVFWIDGVVVSSPALLLIYPCISQRVKLYA